MVVQQPDVTGFTDQQVRFVQFLYNYLLDKKANFKVSHTLCDGLRTNEMIKKKCHL